jgi:hypothetical protein
VIDLLQIVGAILLTHSLWLQRGFFSTEAGMATLFKSHPTRSLWIARLGLLLYLLGYAVKYVRFV